MRVMEYEDYIVVKSGKDSWVFEKRLLSSLCEEIDEWRANDDTEPDYEFIYCEHLDFCELNLWKKLNKRIKNYVIKIIIASL